MCSNFDSQNTNGENMVKYLLYYRSVNVISTIYSTHVQQRAMKYFLSHKRDLLSDISGIVSHKRDLLSDISGIVSHWRDLLSDMSQKRDLLSDIVSQKRDLLSDCQKCYGRTYIQNDHEGGGLELLCAAKNLILHR